MLPYQIKHNAKTQTIFTLKFICLCTLIFLLSIVAIRKFWENINYVPGYPGKNWEWKKPNEVGLSEQQLKTLKEYIKGRGCVVRHGYMIESWGNVEQRWDWASAAKSIYSYFLFKAIELNKIPSMDQKFLKWEPRLGEINAKLNYKDREITWRHMANQVACYGLVEKPGCAFAYNDFQMALFWDTLFLKVYKANYNNVDRKVLEPLLTDVLQFQDKPTFMAFGVEDRPGRAAISVRDMTRFGLLYLREGKWKNKQLLSKEYVQMSTSSPLSNAIPQSDGQLAEMIEDQRAISISLVPTNSGDHRGSYSWLWWTNGIDRKMKRHWPDAPADTYGAFGYGGTRALVMIPSYDLVLCWNDTELHGKKQTNQAIKLLLDAVEKEPAKGI
jgi:hypothetical protein